MTQDDDPVFRNPEGYGIQDLEAPGEPDRQDQPESAPVPSTGREAKDDHRREHREHNEDSPGRGAD